jgi:ATP-dependent DNA helicase MPH1
MSATDEEDYGDIADEDLIDVLTEPSQTLPQLHSDSRLSDDEFIQGEADEPASIQKHIGSANYASGDEDVERRAKKKNNKIRVCTEDVPATTIIGATQADGLPESSPYRIRGPIYRKPRPDSLPRQPSFSAEAHRHLVPQGKPSQSKNSFTRFHSTHDDEVLARELQELENLSQTEASLVQVSSIADDEAFARELQDLPDGAFDSSPETAYHSKRAISIGSSSFSQNGQRLVAPQVGLRQTTLFGGRAPQMESASQAKKVFNYRVDKPLEPPTHHILNQETLKTWIYPLNLGAIRDYQYSIVKNGLFNNLLVALPTGLGKTFIAATIMFNFYRWTKNAQIIFVAPTKPLVAQQVTACYGIVGIPRSDTTMLTGEQAPALRAEEWLTKRVFFMTPQTLINDLSHGLADPKKIVLLVVDEAHRATGDYAYVKVVQFIRRFNTSFRMLALTATPGSSVEGVQEVIDGLEISKVEIRTEESIDIKQFTHRRNIDQILLDPSDEIVMIKDLFTKVLQPLLNKLCQQNGYYNKDPMSLTTFGMHKARQAWFASETGRKASQGLKGMMTSLFGVLASIAHSIKLLNFHGIGPFYTTLKDFREASEDSKAKAKKEILGHPDFKKMMERIQSWINKEDFIGHPKLTYLCDTIMNHFMDAGEGRLGENAPPSSTRVIVFSEFRESAEDITRVLNRHGPMIRASVFVGQADSKRSQGMNQQKQLETIQKFKAGVFNVIVATSIGEEGLDIGQVDLIVCYDASGSPIRMLQRMGRTGRKRAGNIVMLLMRGKEEENFAKAKDNYEQMQKLISNGDRFNFRHDLSTRILPKDVSPVVDKILIDIPAENSQDNTMPVPTRRASKAKKRPPKKFHMPDGVETGFQIASKFGEQGTLDFGVTRKTTKISKIEVTEIPDLESVLLTPAEFTDLHRRYLDVAGSGYQEVQQPDITAQPLAQRALLPTVKVPHGSYTKRCVRLFKTLGDSQRLEDRYYEPYGQEEPQISWTAPSLVEESDFEKDVAPAKKAAPKRPEPVTRKKPQKRALTVDEARNTRTILPPAKRRKQVRERAISMSMEEGDDDEIGGPPSSEGPGDNLSHSEVPSEDESDAESLEDFVDDRTQQSIFSSSLPSRAPPLKELFVSSQLTSTQTTDDLPDLDDILGKPKPKFK